MTVIRRSMNENVDAGEFNGVRFQAGDIRRIYSRSLIHFMTPPERVCRAVFRWKDTVRFSPFIFDTIRTCYGDWA